MTNANGYGAYLTANASSNTISLSTMTSKSAYAALYMTGGRLQHHQRRLPLRFAGYGAWLDPNSTTTP